MISAGAAPQTSHTPAQLRSIASGADRNKCQDCALRKLCLPNACGEHSVDQSLRLEDVVQFNRPILRRREVLFRQGERFESLYVIRAGSVKTTLVNESGEEQVTGFYFPGDILGIDGVNTSQHATTAVALETTSVCVLPFSSLERLASAVPGIQRFLFQTMAKEIQREQQMMFLLSRKTAEQRLATLLQSISSHLNQRKLRGDHFRLSMSRHDIGNYLGLAVETVCRILTRFQKIQLIDAEGRNITLLDRTALDDMAQAATAVTRKTA